MIKFFFKALWINIKFMASVLLVGLGGITYIFTVATTISWVIDGRLHWIFAVLAILSIPILFSILDVMSMSRH